MINLVFMKDKVFVWNANDWFYLRQEHRIVGNLIGTLACLPRQDSMLGLPMMLMPEEVRLLLDQKLAQVVKYDCLSKLPSSDMREKFEQFRKQSYLDQVEYFRSERKKQITNMVDIIVEGKRRKLMGLSTKKQKNKRKKNIDDETFCSQNILEIPDRNTWIEEEFNKIVPITEEMALIQTPTEHPWLNSDDDETGKQIVDFSFPQNPEETLRSKVFSDLWSKGFFITSGYKFGGDFLVYPGDPMKFHSQYIVICRNAHHSMSGSEIVAMCRLGTAVRKSVVLASIISEEDEHSEIEYQTLQWTP